MIVTCWTLLNTSTWPYPHAITWLVFNAQLLVPMVDATHGLVLHSIKHEISEPKHDALLFLQHISLSDSARIATVVFATRLFNAPFICDATWNNYHCGRLLAFEMMFGRLESTWVRQFKLDKAQRGLFRLSPLVARIRSQWSPHQVAPCCAWWPGHVEESQTQLVILWCVKGLHRTRHPNWSEGRPMTCKWFVTMVGKCLK